MEAAAKQTFTFPGAIPPKTIVRSTPRAKRMVFGGKELSRSKEMEAAAKQTFTFLKKQRT